MTIDISRKEPVGETYPRFHYRTQIEGQAEYVRRGCKSRGVKAVTLNHAVAIFSKKKLPLFRDAIMESFKFEEHPHPELESDTLVVKEGRKILGVYIRKETGIYLITTDDNFSHMKCYIYERRIPKYGIAKIYSTVREMKEYLTEVEKLIV